jgi:hypothetical protein
MVLLLIDVVVRSTDAGRLMKVVIKHIFLPPLARLILRDASESSKGQKAFEYCPVHVCNATSLTFCEELC